MDLPTPPRIAEVTVGSIARAASLPMGLVFKRVQRLERTGQISTRRVRGTRLVPATAVPRVLADRPKGRPQGADL